MDLADRQKSHPFELRGAGAEGLDPYNLRLTTEPLRCVTGVTIPPGLVGFCWEVPLSLEVLEQQAPELARVVKSWTDDLKPILERHAAETEGHESPPPERNLSNLGRSWHSQAAPNGP